MMVFRNNHIELATLTNGRSFPRHTHDEFVISANLNGLEQVWLDGKTFIADPHTVTTYNPGQIQASTNRFDRWQCVSLYLRADGFEHYFHQRLCFDTGGIHHPALAARLKTLGRLEPGLGEAQCEEAAVGLLSGLLSGASAARRDGAGESRRARRVKALMLDDLSRPIGLDALAREAGVSAAHLVRTFHQEVGLPPLAWLMQQRMGRARSLLRTGEPISQVALAAGFADQAHFTKAFRRFHAMTPGQFVISIFDNTRRPAAT